MAQAAERLGYCGLTVPEHHFMNILMNPSPLMLAVRVAAATKRIPIITAVVVLPLNDMRRLAGEVALADILSDGRIQIGVGRGAFAYEYYRRFDNVFRSSGTIRGGAIDPVDIEATREEVAEALFIGTPERLIEKLEPYADLGVDEINLNMCIGATHAESLDSTERLAAEVMPHFSRRLRLTA